MKASDPESEKGVLTDTGEDSKLVHRRKRPKVETLFSSLFSDACERRVWLIAESKILASTLGRFRLYRLKQLSLQRISLDQVEKFNNVFISVDLNVSQNEISRFNKIYISFTEHVEVRFQLKGLEQNENIHGGFEIIHDRFYHEF